MNRAVSYVDGELCVAHEDSEGVSIDGPIHIGEATPSTIAQHLFPAAPSEPLTFVSKQQHYNALLIPAAEQVNFDRAHIKCISELEAMVRKISSTSSLDGASKLCVLRGYSDRFEWSLYEKLPCGFFLPSPPNGSYKPSVPTNSEWHRVATNRFTQWVTACHISHVIVLGGIPNLIETLLFHNVEAWALSDEDYVKGALLIPQPSILERADWDIARAAKSLHDDEIPDAYASWKKVKDLYRDAPYDETNLQSLGARIRTVCLQKAAETSPEKKMKKVLELYAMALALSSSKAERAFVKRRLEALHSPLRSEHRETLEDLILKADY